jgi:cytochrome b
MGRTGRRNALVWDAPVRAFHWLAVLCFAGAWFTAESERWRLVHVTLGYTLAGLVVFRLVWGFVGTQHARFAEFVRGPAQVAAYLRSLLAGRPARHAGHNPAGALASVALLALTMGVTATGWAVYVDAGADWLEDVHETLAELMLVLVAVHVAGVLVSSWLHRENLVLAMITGRKPVAPSEEIRRAWHGVAALMLVAVFGFWWLQWRDAPAATSTQTPAAVRADHGDDDDDD